MPEQLLEREADLAALRALIDATWHGSGRVTVIEGGAGIGKTRLLGEARGIAADMGLRVLSARAGQLEGEFAFGVVRQLFEPLLATASQEERADYLGGAAGLSAELFGDSGFGETSERRDLSFAMLHGLYWLAANAALRRPTLLVVDDLHWADAPSLRWLAYLGRRLEGLPLMLAVGTRPPEQAEQTALLLEVLADPAAVLVKPGVLGLESVAILARDVFSEEPDADFCAACHTAAGGNPLYVRALLATLAAGGVRPTAESSAHVHDVGPEPVARAVSLRLARLPPEAAALARAIAVLDQGAELARAAVLAGLEHERAAAAAGALADAELVRLEPRLEFTHPVVRAAIYEATGALERASAHRQAADVLAAARVEPEQTASHLLVIPAAGDAFVCSTLREAARRALGRGAPDAAVTYLRRALGEPPVGEERGAVLLELGLAERRSDVLAAAEHLAEALSLADDPVQYGQVALHCGRALFYAARNGEAVDVLRQGAERLGAESPDLREQLEAELISTAWWEPELYPAAQELLLDAREREPGRIETAALLAVLA